MEVDVRLGADGDLVLHHDVMHDGEETRRLPTGAIRRRRGMATLAEVVDAVPQRVGCSST